jgi:hypothetical protein
MPIKGTFFEVSNIAAVRRGSTKCFIVFSRDYLLFFGLFLQMTLDFSGHI